jgi:hypothetical protein
MVTLFNLLRSWWDCFQEGLHHFVFSQEYISVPVSSPFLPALTILCLFAIIGGNEVTLVGKR